MAIKGMTHQQPQFPEIGQLRKGGTKRKSKTGKEIWGEDLDHFRFTSEIPEVVAAFEAAYDGEPRLINVFLPFRTTDENWEAWQEEYRAGGLVHRCDGETMVLWQKEDGGYSNEPKRCPYADGKERTTKEPGCKPTARLKVVVPELRRLAYVTVLTNSLHDIRNLDSQLRAIESIRQDLRGIPLQLRRAAKTISTPSGDGKRARRQKWLLSIEAAPQWVDLQLAAQEAAAVPQLPDGVRLLPHETENITVHPVTGEIAEPEEWDEGVFDAGEDSDSANGNGQKPPEEGNGKGKLANVKTSAWSEVGKEFAKNEPYYQKDGAPDWEHMCGAAYKLKFASITDDNISDVLDALRTYAHEQTGQQEMELEA